MKRGTFLTASVAAVFFAATSLCAAETMEELAAAAEDQILVYDALPAEAMAPVFAAFNAKYPDIRVDYVNAGGAQGIIARIAQETRAGAVTADVVPLGKESLAELETVAGTTNVLQSVDWQSLGVPAEIIVSYPNPEDQIAVKFNSGLWSIIYNNNQVSTPLKLADLLDPQWKGKIALSETISIWVILTQKWGEEAVTEYVTKLINDQEARIFGRTSEIIPAVSSGELAVGLVQRHSALPSVASGAPITIETTGDVVINSGTLIGVPVNAEHPNAAKLYIAWLVSEEGQTAYDKATGRGLLSVPGTWGYENRDKLQVVEWPNAQYTEYGEISERINSLFPRR